MVFLIDTIGIISYNCRMIISHPLLRHPPGAPIPGLDYEKLNERRKYNLAHQKNVQGFKNKNKNPENEFPAMTNKLLCYGKNNRAFISSAAAAPARP